MKEKVRVASGQGFWGDLLTAPVDQVRGGRIDYLMLDYLAEVTMSIMQKQRSRRPEAGYAKDFVSLMREILPDCVEKDIKVLSNAGGVNVLGCAAEIRQVAQEIGLGGKVKIGMITGETTLCCGSMNFLKTASKSTIWTPASHFLQCVIKSNLQTFT